MLRKHPPIYVPIGLAAVFLIVVALVTTVFVACRKGDDVLDWTPMQEATDGTFYNGLPLGGLALSAYLNEEGAPDRNDRILRAYMAGRLPVSPRVYKDTPTGRRFAQAVRLPYPEEEPQPLTPAVCGYYSSGCVLIMGEGWGEGYGEDSSLRVIPDASGREGYKPLRFIDDETILLEGGFGDGGCGSISYKTIGFSSGSSTRSLHQSICGFEIYEIAFQIDDTEVALLKMRSQNPGEDILEAKAFIIDFVQGEKTVRTLRNIAPPKHLAAMETSSLFDWIRADVDAYFANPSELRVLIGDTVYTFPVPSDEEASQTDAEVGN